MAECWLLNFFSAHVDGLPIPRFRDSSKARPRRAWIFFRCFLDEHINCPSERNVPHKKRSKLYLKEEHLNRSSCFDGKERRRTLHHRASQSAVEKKTQPNNEWIMMKRGRKRSVSALKTVALIKWTSTTALTATHINHYRIHQIPPRRRKKIPLVGGSFVFHRAEESARLGNIFPAVINKLIAKANSTRRTTWEREFVVEKRVEFNCRWMCRVDLEVRSLID